MKKKISKIAVLDIETTDLDFNKGIIVEIAIVKMDNTILFNQIINETNRINNGNNWIFKNSDLTLNLIKKAKSLEYYRKELQEIFNNYFITAYNRDFDLDYLKNRDFKFNKRFSCLLKLTKNIFPYLNSYKFQNVYNTFFRKEKEEHRSLADCLQECKLLQLLIKTMKKG